MRLPWRGQKWSVGPAFDDNGFRIIAQPELRQFETEHRGPARKHSRRPTAILTRWTNILG